MRKYVALISASMVAVALAAAPVAAKNNNGNNGGGNGNSNGNGNGNGGPTPTPSPTPTPTSITLDPIATQCSVGDISPTALSCSGFFAGNLLGGSPDKVAAQTLAINGLGLTGGAVTSEKLEGLNGLKTINFNTFLTGLTYVGLHFGGANGGIGVGESATAFYKFDAGLGLDAFTIDFDGSSNAVLFATGLPTDVTTAVPEPASWAMMILATGMAGASLRGKRRATLPMT